MMRTGGRPLVLADPAAQEFSAIGRQLRDIVIAQIGPEHMAPSEHRQTIAIEGGGDAAAFAGVIQQDFLAGEGLAAIVGPADRYAAAREVFPGFPGLLGVAFVEPGRVEAALGRGEKNIEALARAVDQRLRGGKALAAVRRPGDKNRPVVTLLRPRGVADKQRPVGQGDDFGTGLAIGVDHPARRGRGDHGGIEVLTVVARGRRVDLIAHRKSQPQAAIFREGRFRRLRACWLRLRAGGRRGGGVNHMAAMVLTGLDRWRGAGPRRELAPP